MKKIPEIRKLALRYGLGGILVVFFVLSIVSSFVVWKSYRNQIQASNQLLLQGIGQAIEEYLDQPQLQVRLLSSLLPTMHPWEVQTTMDHFRKLDARFQRIQVHDSTGMILWTSPKDSQSIGHDMSHQLFFQTPKLTGKPYWSPVFLSPIEEIATVAYSQPISNGVLTAFLSMENMADFQLPTEFAEHTQLYVTDHTGTFLLHPNIHKVKERETFPLFSKLHLLKKPQSVLHAQIRIDNQSMYCSGMVLPKYDWGVFLIQPNSILTRPVYELVYSLAAVMLFAGLFASLFGFTFFRKIYRSFQLLIQQMKMLGSSGTANQILYPLFLEYSEITSQFNLMAQQISDRQKALTLKNKELESMLYIATHDLRTPLVNIAGFSHEIQEQIRELQRNINNPEVVYKLTHVDIPNSVHFVTTSTHRMDQLLQGLLRVARLNRTELQPQTINLNELFVRISESLDYAIRQHKAKLTISHLPHIKGDPSEIQQVFTNLIENALKYSSPERIPEINVNSISENGFAWIIVKDNGVGISELHQRKIFNIFFRVGDQPSVPGEGLGLTIVQRIIERHHGEITLTSEVGKGSEFRVKLPVR